MLHRSFRGLMIGFKYISIASFPMALVGCGNNSSQNSADVFDKILHWGSAQKEGAKPAKGNTHKPWFGTWKCETFGPGSTGASIVIRVNADGWMLLGEQKNPFYHRNDKWGAVRQFPSPQDAWFIDLVLEGLNSDPASGKWVSYKNDGRLGWVSWGGEGSENPCDKIG